MLNPPVLSGEPVLPCKASVDVGVHFYAALLLPRLGMPSHALEYEVGK